jgi:hypothetical protein
VVTQWTKEEEASGQRDYASEVSKAFLLIEYEQTGRSILVYEVVGRVLSVVIILAEAFLRYESVRMIPLVFLVFVSGAFWITGVEILRKRCQAISKSIAEGAYLEDREWGTLYIRSYQNRYAERASAVRAFMMRAEPVIWVVLSVVVLVWK